MNVMQKEGGKDDEYISTQEKVGGGKKQKNVGYCDEKRVAQTDLECGTLSNLVLGNL